MRMNEDENDDVYEEKREISVLFSIIFNNNRMIVMMLIRNGRMGYYCSWTRDERREKTDDRDARLDKVSHGTE